MATATIMCLTLNFKRVSLTARPFCRGYDKLRRGGRAEPGAEAPGSVRSPQFGGSRGLRVETFPVRTIACPDDTPVRGSLHDRRTLTW